MNLVQIEEKLSDWLSQAEQTNADRYAIMSDVREFVENNAELHLISKQEFADQLDDLDQRPLESHLFFVKDLKRLIDAVRSKLN